MDADLHCAGLLMSIPALAVVYGGWCARKTYLDADAGIVVCLLHHAMSSIGYAWRLPKTMPTSVVSTAVLQRQVRFGQGEFAMRATFSKGSCYLRCVCSIPGNLCRHHVLPDPRCRRGNAVKFSAVLLFMVLWFTLQLRPIAPHGVVLDGTGCLYGG